MDRPPKFASDAEAADWYDTHDTAHLMDELPAESAPVVVTRTRPAKKPVGLRLRPDYLDAIKRVAESKGIPYQTLIQLWLVDSLRREAPELLPR